MPKRDRVILICGNDPFCHSLTALISSIGLTPAQFESGRDFLCRFDRNQPGCLIIDFDEPEFEGLHVVDELAPLPLAPPIIGLIGPQNVTPVVMAARRGVATFLQKQHVSHGEILDKIQSAIAQDARQRSDFARRMEVQTRFNTLTGAECQTLKLLLRGDELQVIADDLKVSRRTVENRRATVMEKLNVDCLARLIELTMKYELI